MPFKYIAIFRRRPDRDVGSPTFPLAPDLISPYCFPYGYILFIRQDFSSFTFGYILHPSSMLSRCAMRSVVFETSLQRTLRVLLLLLQNRPIATVFGSRNSKYEKLDTMMLTCHSTRRENVEYDESRRLLDNYRQSFLLTNT